MAQLQVSQAMVLVWVPSSASDRGTARIGKPPEKTGWGSVLLLARANQVLRWLNAKLLLRQMLQAMAGRGQVKRHPLQARSTA